mmetsp:Transcript_44366/g.69375  ORF Transcript_44366/g.69375 Transcript_44366/m.69375 type:complete len:424 (+) Transcript_44366:92-1363(+)
MAAGALAPQLLAILVSFVLNLDLAGSEFSQALSPSGLLAFAGGTFGFPRGAGPNCQSPKDRTGTLCSRAWGTPVVLAKARVTGRVGSDASGVGGLVALRVRPDKRPERDERFCLPHSRFEGKFVPSNEFGVGVTFQAEMEALDRLDEQERESMRRKNEDLFDKDGDVRFGIVRRSNGNGMRAAPKPAWNRRSAAARKKWKDPEYRRTRLGSSSSDLEEGEYEDSWDDGEAWSQGLKEPAEASTFEGAVETEYVGAEDMGAEGSKTAKLKLMRRDQNQWQAERLGVGEAPSKPLERRLQKRRNYKMAAIRRKGGTARPSLTKALLRLANLEYHTDTVNQNNKSLTDIVSMGKSELQTLGFSAPEAVRFLETVGKLSMTELETEAQVVEEEAKREQRRLYMREYRRRKKLEKAKLENSDSGAKSE